MGAAAKTVLGAAVALYVVSAISAVIAEDPRGLAGAVQAATAATQPRPAVGDARIIGFALNFHHTQDLRAYLDAVEKLAGMGFNAVEVLTPAFQRDGAATEIKLIYEPGLSPQRDHLVALLRHAKAAGMTTTLMPLVLFTDPRGNEWRGKISPEDWDSWWVSYTETLDYFIDVANEAEVDVLMVGSELISTEGQTERWTQVIRHARSRFAGTLCYSTNWDHYHHPAFWRELDLIGINGYWEITDEVDPQPPWDQMMRRWEQIRGEVMGFARRMDRPVLLTEIGYPSLPWALKDPWNYINSDETPAAPDVQALGYAVFLNAWEDLLTPPPRAPATASGEPIEPDDTTVDDGDGYPAATGQPQLLRGVYFYSWDPYQSGGQSDTGYGVEGKPALTLLRRWLETGHAPPPTVAPSQRGG